MKLIRFPQQTVVIAENQDEYLDMPAHVHGDDMGTTTCCWKLTLRERIKLLFTGKLWHSICTFNGPMQPQRIATEPPAFELDEDTVHSMEVVSGRSIDEMKEELRELWGDLPHPELRDVNPAQSDLMREVGTPYTFAMACIDNMTCTGVGAVQDNIEGLVRLWEKKGAVVGHKQEWVDEQGMVAAVDFIFDDPDKDNVRHGRTNTEGLTKGAKTELMVTEVV